MPTSSEALIPDRVQDEAYSLPEGAGKLAGGASHRTNREQGLRPGGTLEIQGERTISAAPAGHARQVKGRRDQFYLPRLKDRGSFDPEGHPESSRGCREERPESPDHFETGWRPGRDAGSAGDFFSCCVLPSLLSRPCRGGGRWLGRPGVPSFLGHPRLPSE